MINQNYVFVMETLIVQIRFSYYWYEFLFTFTAPHLPELICVSICHINLG